MKNLTSLFSHAFLAAALLTGAGMASAAAVYHVDIKTSGFDTTGSDTGYLDMYFAPFGSVDPVTATVTGLKGDFTGGPMSSGVTIGSNGALSFANDFSTDYLRTFKLGSDISFDISFDGLPSATGTAGFSADIINADYSAYLSNAVTFTLTSDGVGVASDAAITSVGQAAAVPEPSAAALVLIGLAMAGAVARRRA
ncbi:hypothetical protein AB595_05615 [Massilia sp. WF1]|uniref:NF038129 family PEP-CTERM protein n=1 Tax=unclassified Massilia TaxID=2609279 RepID=UPI00064B72D7|nr:MULTISPECIES: NF038129 family PEP-CTERM protein [unclassified Massilia]ALK96352.1 hypothetical protein AM586_08720 [Massilia sp. WG5]KLU37664.1 hypothetical protein AB595_05615 [Massilia sp. WF1]